MRVASLLLILLAGVAAPACRQNDCIRARDKLRHCELAEGYFNFDGDCNAEVQASMRCILQASCAELKQGDRIAKCLAPRR